MTNTRKSKTNKGKQKQAIKKPNLGALKGDYILSDDLVEKFGLDNILGLQARYWRNVKKLVESYFENMETWSNGETVIKELAINLRALGGSTDSKEQVRLYAWRVADYLESAVVRNDFVPYYNLKKMEANLSRQKQLARLEGDTTGAVLSQLGAKRLREEESQEEASSSRKIDALFEDSSSESEHSEGFITLRQDNKSFNLQPPNTNVISPHRPIIQADQRDRLTKCFDICLSSDTAACCSEETRELFDSNKDEQRRNFCISNIDGAMDLIKIIFSLDNNLDFPKGVFNAEVDGSQNHGFLKFIKYSIVDFFLNTQRPMLHNQGEERTIFCECIIPLFKAFGSMTKTISYSWCEKKALNNDYLWISQNDFNKHGINANLLDGIGNLKSTMNFILIESSGFNKEENIGHSLGDTIKNIKSGSDTLKYFMSNFKCASFTTLKKVHIYSCQIIQQKITLIQYSILNPSTWRVLECRTAEVPESFEGLKKYIKIWELFAFLYLDIKHQEAVLKDLEEENLGLKPVPRGEIVDYVLSQSH